MPSPHLRPAWAVCVSETGWWVWPDLASASLLWYPGPIQVEELGFLEVEAEAKMESLQALVPGQPPVLVSGLVFGFSGCGYWTAGPFSWAQVALPHQSSQGPGGLGDAALPLVAPHWLGSQGGSPRPGGRLSFPSLPAKCFRPFSHPLPHGPR